MDENTFNILTEVLQELGALQQFDDQNGRLIVARNLAKLETVLKFYGDTGASHPKRRFFDTILGG